MAVDLTQFGAVSYGETVCQLKRYSVQESPIVRDQVGRIVTRIEFSGEGEICADDQAGLQALIAGVMLAYNADGGNLIVTGLGGAAEYSLAAATCFDNGPHMSCEVTDGPGILTKTVKLKAWALCPPPGLENPIDVYKVEYILRPDGLTNVRRIGQLIGPNGVRWFTKHTMKDFAGGYPHGGWKVDASYTTGMDQSMSIVSYRLEAMQFLGLPIVGAGDLAIAAVDGTCTVAVELEESGRKVTTYNFDLLVNGDPQAMLDHLYEVNFNNVPEQAKKILRQSFSFETIRENRLRASYTLLESTDGTPLMNLQQSLRVLPPMNTWEEKRYIGADPILIQSPRSIGRVMQSGSAIAAGKHLEAAHTLYSFAAQPAAVNYSDLNALEKQTTWDYELFAVDGQGNPLDANAVSQILLNQITRSFLEKKYKPAETTAP